MVYWRRRQPEPEARRLLGREPAWFVSAHQGGADLRLHQQSVQSQIRDRRHFLRYAIDGRGRDTERAERPPHGHAGAAALGLSRDACKAVRPIGRSRHAWSFPRADKLKMLCEVGSRGPGPVSGVELLDLALLAPASLHLTPSKATALVMVREVMCERL